MSPCNHAAVDTTQADEFLAEILSEAYVTEAEAMEAFDILRDQVGDTRSFVCNYPPPVLCGGTDHANVFLVLHARRINSPDDSRPISPHTHTRSRTRDAMRCVASCAFVTPNCKDETMPIELLGDALRAIGLNPTEVQVMDLANKCVFPLRRQ